MTAATDVISFGTSWERRVQTAAAFTGSMSFLLFLASFVALWLFVALILCPPLWIFFLAYAAWMAVDNSAYKPTRKPRLRGLKWWHAFGDYFPLTLVKTAQIDPDGKYIFGYHPHGVISVGAFGSFATEGARTLDLSPEALKEGEPDAASRTVRGFSSLFPGIEVRLVTLAINFRVPLLREYILSFGALCADRRSFRSTLARGTGSAIAVVVGGAEESTETRAGEIVLVLEKRKGFVREAMAAGAKLVPVLAFGENDLYQVKHFDEGHPLRSLQDKFRKLAGFTVPVFTGREIFVKVFGLMPQRKPLWVVVGAPIECKHIPSFDSKNEEHKAALEDAHARYIAAVGQLYEDYKDHPLQPYRSPSEAGAEYHRYGSFDDKDGTHHGGLTVAS